MVCVFVYAWTRVCETTMWLKTATALNICKILGCLKQNNQTFITPNQSVSACPHVKIVAHNHHVLPHLDRFNNKHSQMVHFIEFP